MRGKRKEKEDEANTISTVEVSEVTNTSVQDDKMDPPGNSVSTPCDLCVSCDPVNSDVQIRNSQGDKTDISLPRTSNRIKNSPATKSNDFFMVASKVERTKKNVSSPLPSDNNPKQIYGPQLCTNLQLNLNTNANESFTNHRHATTNKNDDTKNILKIFHQNIRGLKGKKDELMLHLHTDAPHLICLTEHHLKKYELDVTPVSKYKLGANYCRTNLKYGGVCIFIKENLKFTNINLHKHCKEQDMEIAAIQLKLNKINTVILCVYGAPSGDFDCFLNKLDNILNSLHCFKTEFIICGDININYLENSNKKKKLDYILGTYNLFPTRTTNSSATLIDNILHRQQDYLTTMHNS
jgi:exonuclease III